MDHVVETAQDAVGNTRTAADRLHRMCKEARDDMQKATEVAREEFTATVENVREELGKAIEGVSAAVKRAGNDGGEEEGAQRYSTTYASVLGSCLPVAHQSTLARARVRDHLVLIDKDPAVTTNNLDELTEKELVTKANEALDKMEHTNGSRPEGMRMVGGKKLRDSGVIYEACSVEAAKWLRGARLTFAEKFGGTSVVKDRGMSIIVEYVPISHNPEALAEYERIE